MIEHLTAHDIAAEAEMVRSKFKGTILLLEGTDDILLFERFIDPIQCYMLISYGRDNAIKAVSLLESNVTGVLAIVDADHWHLIGYKHPSPNVIITDMHDIEIMMLNSDALPRILREYGSPSKIIKFVTSPRLHTVLDCLLEICVPIGILRLISYEDNLSLKFKELKFKGFITAKSMVIDIDKMVHAVVNNTNKPGIDPSHLILQVIDTSTTHSYDPNQLCSGHDVTEVLGIGLRKAIGSQVEAIACRANVESALRLAYDVSQLAKSKLYHEVRKWESANTPYMVFLP